jgi:hypothetical protein
MPHHGSFHIFMTDDASENRNLIGGQGCPPASRSRPELGNFWVSGEPHPDRLVGSNCDFVHVQEQMLANRKNHIFRDTHGLGNSTDISSHAPNGGMQGLGLCAGDAFAGPCHPFQRRSRVGPPCFSSCCRPLSSSLPSNYIRVRRPSDAGR